MYLYFIILSSLKSFAPTRSSQTSTAYPLGLPLLMQPESLHPDRVGEPHPLALFLM